MSSQQKEIVLAVAEYLSSVLRPCWDIQPAKHISLLAENSEQLAAVIPNRISWKRQSRGVVCSVHFIDIVFIGRVGLLDIDVMVNEIDRQARSFLRNEVAQVSTWACMSAETIDEAAAGFDPESLTETPSQYIGGLRLEFWGY